MSVVVLLLVFFTRYYCGSSSDSSSAGNGSGSVNTEETALVLPNGNPEHGTLQEHGDFLRIVGFVRLWPTHKVGGMQSHAESLYRGLAERGHLVHVFVSHHPREPSETNEVHGRLVIHYAPHGKPAEYSPEYFDWSYQLVLQLHSVIQFDLIHSESNAARRFLRSKIMPTVVTWHGFGYETWRSKLNYFYMNAEPGRMMEELKHMDFAEEFDMMLGYHHHVAISHQAAADLREVMYIDEERVHMILNGINLVNFKQDFDVKAHFRSKNIIPAEGLVIGIGGKLTTMKGSQKVLDIVDALTSYGSFPVYICVAGVGEMLAKWKRMALSNKRIVILGELDTLGMVKFYQAIDIFVNPTAYYRGLDLTMQEAMACGVPVIATRTGSIKKTIISEIDGVASGATFTLGDGSSLFRTIIEFGTNRQFIAQRGNAARKKAVDEFPIGRMLSSYESLFSRIVMQFKQNQWQGRLCLTCEGGSSVPHT